MSDADGAPRTRANWVPAPHYFNLNMACRTLTEAFGHCVYLVGSSLHRRDFRDVDVRVMLSDEEFARLFPGATPANPGLDALWSILCSSISLFLSQQTGLPVDFQIQQSSDANARYSGERNALGIFMAVPR